MGIGREQRNALRSTAAIFEDMSDEEIASAVYEQIREHGESRMHFVYPESDVVSQIKEANAEEAANAD